MKQNDELGSRIGFQGSNMPNVPRPPDSKNTPPLTSSLNMLHDGNKEKEGGDKFIDANDQAVVVSSNSDMEVVHETPESAS